MFLVNSRLGLFSAANFLAPLIPKLRGNFAEFLNNTSPAGLRLLTPPTCVGLRYGRQYPKMLSFSRQCRCFLFATLISLPSYRSQYKSRGNQRPARNFSLRPWHRQYWRLRNFHRMCIDYAFRPRLSSRLTLRGRTFLKKPWAFDHYDSHIILATHSGILTSASSRCPFSHPSSYNRTLLYHSSYDES